ncbi:hypothetical protein, partial [Klebsiella pneumoniae]|uniref:hypothetical protein n=1 Tax=Klebsiella pneumoniae TaxID=573 RepID=UPI0025A237E5
IAAAHGILHNALVEIEDGVAANVRTAGVVDIVVATCASVSEGCAINDFNAYIDADFLPSTCDILHNFAGACIPGGRS